MAHAHQWYTAQYLLLTLPDAEGFADRFCQWRCKTCPLYSEIDGSVRVGAPLYWPEYWHQTDPGSPWKRSPGARRWQRAQRHRGG